jgi:hypothetical protein
MSADTKLRRSMTGIINALYPPCRIYRKIDPVKYANPEVCKDAKACTELSVICQMSAGVVIAGE